MGKKPQSISELVMDYLSFQHRIEQSTAELTSRVFLYLSKITGDIPIEQFGYSEAERFQSWIVESGRNKVTANIYLKSARPVFRWAIRRGYITEDPFENLRLFRIPKQRIRIYEHWEFVEMMLNCPSNIWRIRLLLAKTAGLRRGEVLNLTVDDIDFAREIIYVQAKKETQHTWRWQPKDKDLRALPLVPELSKVLTVILERLPEGQPYLTITPKRYRQIQQLRKMGRLPYRVRKCPDENWSKPFQRILRRSQIKNATFHDLRRTCITEWLENGLQPHEVMQLAGHNSVETTMRYYTAIRQTLLDKARLASQKVFGATGLEPATS